jgi:hypothetical protein
MPGVATRKAFDGQQGALASAVFFERLDSVFGTTRVKPAVPPDQGADRKPVYAHKQNKQPIH